MLNQSVFISNDEIAAFLESCRELEVEVGGVSPDQTTEGYSWVDISARVTPTTMFILGQMTSMNRQRAFSESKFDPKNAFVLP